MFQPSRNQAGGVWPDASQDDAAREVEFARKLKCAGLVLNHVKDERDPASIPHRMIMEDMLEVPVLGEVMHGETDGGELVAALNVVRRPSADV